MISSFSFKTLLVSLLSLGAFTAPSYALNNGGFENGLNSWNSVGDATTRNSAFGINPTESNSLAVLTTQTTVPEAIVGFPGGWDGFFCLDSFCLEPSALDPDPENFIFASEGAAIKQILNVQAGDTLTFDWNFLTEDSVSPDYAFVVLAPSSNLSALTYNDLIKLPAPNAPLSTFTGVQPFNVNSQKTGWKNFSHTFTTSGEYIFGMGVLDVDDTDDVDGLSALLVDKIELNALPTPQPVSEPASIIAILTALGSGIALKRKR